MSEKDKSELIGCIIDIFEDDLHNRDMQMQELNPDGIFFKDEAYDNVASKLETLLKECKLI